MLILVVDDNAMVLRGAHRCLEALGFDVLVAGDPLLALQLLTTHPECAAVVADVDMPMMSGIELLLAIRDAGVVLPSLLMSGRPTTTEVAPLLRKPFTLVQLADALAGIGIVGPTPRDSVSQRACL